MNILIAIVSILGLTIFLILELLKGKREIHMLNLKKRYDDMELLFIQKNISLSKEAANKLRVFKNLSVNPEYLDMQVLICTKFMLEKSQHKLHEDKSNFDSTLKSLGDDFYKIFLEFDKSANALVKLSLYKPSFIWFFTSMFLKYLIASRVANIKKAKKVFTFAQENSEVITYQGMNHNLI